jgi:hypothetical protein
VKTDKVASTERSVGTPKKAYSRPDVWVCFQLERQEILESNCRESRRYYRAFKLVKNKR